MKTIITLLCTIGLAACTINFNSTVPRPQVFVSRQPDPAPAAQPAPNPPQDGDDPDDWLTPVPRPMFNENTDPNDDGRPAVDETPLEIKI